MKVKENKFSVLGMACDYLYCKGWGRFGCINFDDGKSMHDECFSFWKRLKAGEITPNQEKEALNSLWSKKISELSGQTKELFQKWVYGRKLFLEQFNN